MSTNPAIAGKQASIRRYELGRPIIRREQRIAFERIHRAIAQGWSDSMKEYLPSEAALQFEGMDFDAFSSLSIDTSPCTQMVLFAIASTPISGFLMMSGALARSIVSGRLGLKSVSNRDAKEPFTRIETSIARETIRAMLTRLSGAYASAGIGNISNIRECDDFAASFPFAPEEHLALLKFHLGAVGEELPLLIGLSDHVVSAVYERHPAAVVNSDSRDAIVDVVKHLPIEIEVVLGSWKVPIAELLQLRAGDRVVLPDGENAWLESRGIRIRRASIEVSDNRASIVVRGSARIR
jgi:flagellar motor switch protein FliM